MPAGKGRGLLLVFVDVPADVEAEFNRWYNEEHIPERLAIPGVLNAARYEAVRGGPKYLAVYELVEPEVFHSPAWEERHRNPTPWTKRMSPSVVGTNYIRNLYRLIYPSMVDSATANAGMSPTLLIGRMAPPPEMEAQFNKAYDGERMELYRTRIPGYIRGRRFVAVEGEPKFVTVHECQSPWVPESEEWKAVTNAVTPEWSKVRPHVKFAPGAPGVYRRIYPY